MFATEGASQFGGGGFMPRCDHLLITLLFVCFMLMYVKLGLVSVQSSKE